MKAQGFRAFKIGWGPFGPANAATDEAIVRAAREAVGAGSRLMVDAGGSDAFWPTDTSGRSAPRGMLADYDVHWFEEALAPDALEDYVAAASNIRPCRSPVAKCSRDGNGSDRGLRRGAFDIVQPDVPKSAASARSGASPGWRRKTDRFIPHGWNTAVGLAADLQLASAFSAD